MIPSDCSLVERVHEYRRLERKNLTEWDGMNYLQQNVYISVSLVG